MRLLPGSRVGWGKFPSDDQITVFTRMHSPAWRSAEVIPLEDMDSKRFENLISGVAGYCSWVQRMLPCKSSISCLQGVLPMSFYFLSQAYFLQDSMEVSSCSSEITVLFDVWNVILTHLNYYSMVWLSTVHSTGQMSQIQYTVCCCCCISDECVNRQLFAKETLKMVICQSCV